MFFTRIKDTMNYTKKEIKELKEAISYHIINKVQYTDVYEFNGEIAIENISYYVTANVNTKDQGEPYMDGNSLSYEDGDYKEMDFDDVDLQELSEIVKDELEKIF